MEMDRAYLAASGCSIRPHRPCCDDARAARIVGADWLVLLSARAYNAMVNQTTSPENLAQVHGAPAGDQ